MDAFMPDSYVQIDVIKKDTEKEIVHCHLYTGQRCVTIVMALWEYDNLVRDGFFIRDGKNRDSAGVLNTTNSYYLQEAESNG